MEDGYAQAHPLTFTDFLEKMKDPRAADLVRSIKAFIASFKSVPPDAAMYSQRVQQFLASCDGSFQTHPLWAGTDEASIEAAGEGLEKYIMTKLYDKCFRLAASDREGDELLFTHLRALSLFVKPEHLEIPNYFTNETQWGLAQKELHKINSYKAPRDKLVCILNCCRVINNLLNMTNSGPAGADDFFPVLVYIVIRTNPPNLRSNLEYIRRFRAASRLVSEAAYFYTNMESAAQFIEHINSKSFHMDEELFFNKMVAAGVPRDRLQPPAAQPASPVRTPTPLPPSLPGRLLSVPSGIPDLVVARSVAELEAEGVGHLIDAEAQGNLRNKYRWLYSSVGDLIVSDVESLLAAYKELVLRYETLSRAVAAQQTVDMASLLTVCDSGQRPPEPAPQAGVDRKPGVSIPQPVGSDAKGGTKPEAPPLETLPEPDQVPPITDIAEPSSPAPLAEGEPPPEASGLGVESAGETPVYLLDSQLEPSESQQLPGTPRAGIASPFHDGDAPPESVASQPAADDGGADQANTTAAETEDLLVPARQSPEPDAAVASEDERSGGDLPSENSAGRGVEPPSGAAQSVPAAAEELLSMDSGPADTRMPQTEPTDMAARFADEATAEEQSEQGLPAPSGGLSAIDMQRDCEEATAEALAEQSVAIDQSFEQALTGAGAAEIPASEGTEWSASANESLI
mmetsp:Transcript_16201/g.41387  ORF Transcript_16201/g.41387 Transcript_16201/m.41387 type:complete len:685 (+) Transcript_16201:495-2549(+)